nr:ribonuclease H-like domain-containing protein [Tanacetum cinerariifolium]
MEAIEKRVGGNKESKKTQKTLLKQQYENSMDQSQKDLIKPMIGFKKLTSQLEILGETISQEDMNLKLLRNGYVNHESQKISKEDWKEGWALRENRNREPVRRNVTVETIKMQKLWWLKMDLGVGYHAVPPPYTGNFMPPKPDLIFADVDEYVVSTSVTSVHSVATNKAKTSESKPKSVSEPLIEDWISDSEDENETETMSKQRKPSFAKIQVSNGLGPQEKPIFLLYVQRNPQLELQEKRVIDSGCSRHMTRNMSYLSEYEKTDGGYVSFGGDPKGGKITDLMRSGFKTLNSARKTLQEQ